MTRVGLPPHSKKKKMVEEIKHLFYAQQIFFFENSAVYEIKWRNIVEPGRSQITIWRMRIKCWVTKFTDKRSKYVIYIFTVTVVTRTRRNVMFKRTLPVLLHLRKRKQQDYLMN